MIAVKTEDGEKTAICNVTVADEGDLELIWTSKGDSAGLMCIVLFIVL